VTLPDADSVTVIPDTGVANNFVTGISATGAVTKAQPSFADVSGSLTCAQMPALTGDVTSSAGSCATTLAAGTGGGTLLNYQKAGAAVVGDGTDKTVFTYTLPAGTLAAGKGVRIVSAFQHSSGTANLSYKLWFGATAVHTQSATSTQVGRLTSYVFNDPGSTTQQQGTVTDAIFGTAPQAPSSTPATPAENTAANPVVIKLTFNGPNTDQVTPKMWVVELIK
jgi:hypothetical protein